MAMACDVQSCSLGYVFHCFMPFIHPFLFYFEILTSFSRFRNFASCPCMSPACVIVYPTPISFLCPPLSLPSVFSLCVPLSQCQFVFIPSVKRSSIFVVSSSLGVFDLCLVLPGSRLCLLFT